MNEKMPRTPFSTQLSGSAKETEIRIRNLFTGPKKRPPVPFLILMFSICIFCGNIVSCQFKEETPPDASSVSSSGQDGGIDPQTDRLREMVLDYYQERYSPRRVYWGSDQPDAPEEKSIRLEALQYLGETALHETVGVAYELSTSWYIQQNGQDIWAPGADVLVLSRSPDGGEFQRVLGCASPNTEGMAVEDIIRQTAWGLSDLEVCLFRDGFPTPVGPGNWVELFPDLEPEVTVHEDWEPIYWPGDYWDEWSAEGVTALRYYNAELGSFHLNSMKVTRSDMYTQKGIRVGSTREEVMAAYPGAKAGNYWDMYPGEDLVYDIPGSEDTAELGPALLFFFDGDTVGQITLENMFN